MAGRGSAIWAPSPVEAEHVFLLRPPAEDMYKRFMFKKTMVVVACLLAAVVIVAHWSTVVRFVLFLLHRSRRRSQDHSHSQSENDSNENEAQSDQLIVVGTFKAEREDGDSKPLRPIQMVKFSSRAAGYRMIGAECMICLCDFKSSEKIGVLPDCGHGFHRPCIEMWLFSHSNCPICRHSLTQEPS